MRYEMFKKRLALASIGLAIMAGCDPKKAQDPPTPTTPATPKVSMDEVKRDVAKSINTTAAYTQQERDKMIADMKAKMKVMDENIESLRLKGKVLASDARANWELKMAVLEERRKLTDEKLSEFGASTSKAWGDMEAGVKSAWEELSKAFQEASNEF